MTTTDPYAATESATTEGRVFTVTGQDWDSLVTGIADEGDGEDGKTRWFHRRAKAGDGRSAIRFPTVGAKSSN